MLLTEFDKRTALGVKQTFPRQVEYPEFSEHLAKAVCAQVNSQILANIPQIDDYSCPMCMEIKWRPVKLGCGHVFCIRCLIVMQNNKQHNCPFCRERTVTEANSGISTLRRKRLRRELMFDQTTLTTKWLLSLRSGSQMKSRPSSATTNSWPVSTSMERCMLLKSASSCENSFSSLPFLMMCIY
jgi:hypothetical protein